MTIARSNGLRMKIVLVWLATCFGVVGCSAAGAAQSVGPTSGSASHGLVRTGLVSERGGRVHLTDYLNSDSSTSGVILVGAVGDFGSGRLNQSTGHLDLHLSRGSFTLQLAHLDVAFLTALRGLPVNHSTCSAFASVSGTAPIVSVTGTGAYSHLTGAFSLTITLDEVFQPGGCSELSPFAAQSIVTSGWGMIKNH